MSAWIEIAFADITEIARDVALHVSAWIEITDMEDLLLAYWVALHVSAWIEISHASNFREIARGRTPCECVD